MIEVGRELQRDAVAAGEKAPSVGQALGPVQPSRQAQAVRALARRVAHPTVGQRQQGRAGAGLNRAEVRVERCLSDRPIIEV